MKKKRFSVEQMIGVLKQAEVGVPVAEVIQKAGISEQTFYRRKAEYAGLEVDQVRQMAQLQEENLQLKRQPRLSCMTVWMCQRTHPWGPKPPG
jgi:putative transposase